MRRLIARRLAVSLFILFAVSVIIFCATLLLPGSPATAILGQQATPERIAALEAEMNLDKPPVARYFLWLAGVFTGDFGTSTSTGGPVVELLGGPLVNSWLDRDLRIGARLQMRDGSSRLAATGPVARASRNWRSTLTARRTRG